MRAGKRVHHGLHHHVPRMSRLRTPASFADAFSKATLTLALAIVVVNVYRHLVLDAADPYKCAALLNHGHWLDPPDRQLGQKPFTNWQPPGCLLHKYRTPEIASCNGEGKILFVGDSGTRQVFWATARKIEGDSKWVFNEQAQLDTHSDIEYSRDGANLKFLWDPFLNSSGLHDELKAFRDRQAFTFKEEKDNAEAGSVMESAPRRPAVILVGGGLWHARHLQTDFLAQFQASIESIAASAYPEDTMANWRNIPDSGDDGVGDQVYFAPVLEPLYARLSPSREATIMPEKINEMNDYLHQQSARKGLNVLWSYANMTSGRPETYGESGLHVIENVASSMADVLLNLRCNAKAARREGYPFDRTCCIAYKPLSWIGIIGLVSTAVVLLYVAFSAARGKPTTSGLVHIDKSTSRQRSVVTSANATKSVPVALLTILLCVWYCFLADRTQVFYKAENQFANLDFRVLIGFTVVGCLFTIKGPTSPAARRHSNPYPESIIQQTFLPRSQSDEFKGWMQVYVLVYCYTGASDILDLYEVSRVLVALYLFLSGYGHTMYFLQKKDYSLQRVATVLLRLNILAVFFSFLMTRPYTSYYFTSLVSFWFLVVYLTLRPANHANGSLRFVVGKVVVSALLATCFIHIKGILELCFSVLGVTCRAKLSVDEWTFHLGTDKYIVYVGMVVAIIHIRVASILHTPQVHPDRFVQAMVNYFDVFRKIAIYAALIVIPVFWILTRRSHDKADYDWWMPYISWLPVVSLIILRNATRFLRSYHCAAFAGLGRISLASYMLSNHIWLAGDGRGSLKVGLGGGDGSVWNDRWRDLAILTPIFLGLAWHVSAATATVTAWIMNTGEDEAKREDVVNSSHTSVGSELEMLDYKSTLPSPNTQGDMRSNMDRNRQRLDMSGPLRRRLVTIVIAIWLGSLVAW